MDSLKFLAVIPARYASTRFPGKPLARLGGRTGHPARLEAGDAGVRRRSRRHRRSAHLRCGGGLWRPCRHDLARSSQRHRPLSGSRRQTGRRPRRHRQRTGRRTLHRPLAVAGDRPLLRRSVDRHRHARQTLHRGRRTRRTGKSQFAESRARQRGPGTLFLTLGDPLPAGACRARSGSHAIPSTNISACTPSAARRCTR